MTKIDIVKPQQARTDELTIDIAVKLSSGLHRVSKLRYGKDELYLIPTTHKKGKPGIDLKTSYHGSGEIHSKLTRGKLRQATFKFGGGKTELLGIETLGEATPTEKDTEIVLWRKQGTPLNSIEGAVEINPDQQGAQQTTNIAAVAANYPSLQKSDADYILEIDTESTPWIDTKYFLVQPGNVDALKERIKEITDRWNDTNTKVNWRPHEFMTVEKAELFTNLSPWLAIVLFSKKAKGNRRA